MKRTIRERLRWKLWWFVSGLPGICPANAHTLIIYGDRRDPRIDDSCRRDCERNGSCWCGRLPEPNRAKSPAGVSEHTEP